MRILVTGASGQLGGYLLRELQLRGLPTYGWSGSRSGEWFGCRVQPVDLTDERALFDAFADCAPEIVIHAAAMSKIADCHRTPGWARRVNSRATARLCDLCDRTGARLVYVSTDLVFDGQRGHYRENDQAVPLSIYGGTKLCAEQAVLAMPRGIVARLSLLYGPSLLPQLSFFGQQIAALRSGKHIQLFTDEWRTPLALPTAASALVALALSPETGLFHIGGPERMSRFEMGQTLAAALGVDPAALLAVSQRDAPAPEPRPRDVSLNSSKWRTAFPDHAWPRMTEVLTTMALR
jgi:dTDP-4-dehydrorhamnose reductase